MYNISKERKSSQQSCLHVALSCYVPTANSKTREHCGHHHTEGRVTSGKGRRCEELQGLCHLSPLGAAWEGLSPCQSGVGSALAPPPSTTLIASHPKRFKRSLRYFQGDLTATCWYLHGAYKEFYTKRGVFKTGNLQISVK